MKINRVHISYLDDLNGTKYKIIATLNDVMLWTKIQWVSVRSHELLEVKFFTEVLMGGGEKTKYGWGGVRKENFIKTEVMEAFDYRNMMDKFVKNKSLVKKQFDA